MSTYFILTASHDPNYCSINDRPEALEGKKWMLASGVRIGDMYPQGVSLVMSRREPGIIVPDMVSNSLHLCIMSGRMKRLLAHESGADVEFLPVTISNHKGRIASDEAYIANVLDFNDCIDMSRTDADESAIDPGTLTGLFSLQVDLARIRPEAKWFRLTQMPSIMLVRDDLRVILEQSGITGVHYISMGESCMLF